MMWHDLPVGVTWATCRSHMIYLGVAPRTCRCGHAASNVGSSSSGSNSAPVGLDEGGNVLNMFPENWDQGSTK